MSAALQLEGEDRQDASTMRNCPELETRRRLAQPPGTVETCRSQSCGIPEGPRSLADQVAAHSTLVPQVRQPLVARRRSTTEAPSTQRSSMLQTAEEAGARPDTRRMLKVVRLHVEFLASLLDGHPTAARETIDDLHESIDRLQRLCG